jgi:hypothetical protein
MGDLADAFISMTRVWTQALKQRCKEDEDYELTCTTSHGWMRVGHITVRSDGVALVTGEDPNGNFAERLCYSHALDLTAIIVKKTDKKASIGFSIERKD